MTSCSSFQVIEIWHDFFLVKMNAGCEEMVIYDKYFERETSNVSVMEEKGISLLEIQIYMGNTLNV